MPRGQRARPGNCVASLVELAPPFHEVPGPAGQLGHLRAGRSLGRSGRRWQRSGGSRPQVATVPGAQPVSRAVAPRTLREAGAGTHHLCLHWLFRSFVHSFTPELLGASSLQGAGVGVLGIDLPLRSWKSPGTGKCPEARLLPGEGGFPITGSVREASWRR